MPAAFATQVVAVDEQDAVIAEAVVAAVARGVAVVQAVVVAQVFVAWQQTVPAVVLVAVYAQAVAATGAGYVRFFAGDVFRSVGGSLAAVFLL